MRKQMSEKILIMIVILLLCCVSGCGKGGNTPSETLKEVEGIYFISRSGYNSGVFTYFEPFILFRDGSIRKRLEKPVETLNLSEDKKDFPEEWGTWVRHGSSITVTFSEPETWTNWYVAFPADKNERLNATYTSFFALANSHRGEEYSFNSDGSFTTKKGTGNGSNTLQGTYKLHGYGLYLDFDSGEKEEWSFGFYPKEGKKNTHAFLMGSDNFTVKK